MERRGEERRGEERRGESNESIRFVSLSRPTHTVNPPYSRILTCNATHAMIYLFYRTQVERKQLTVLCERTSAINYINMECDSTAIYHHQ